MEAKIRGFTDLVVWRKAHELALQVYQVSKKFPSDERFGLTSQMRRSSVSVPANIAEGFQKRSQKDKLNFYNIAQGSLAELRYYVIISRDLGYHNQYASLWALVMDVSRLLSALIKKIEEKMT